MSEQEGSGALALAHQHTISRMITSSPSSSARAINDDRPDPWDDIILRLSVGNGTVAKRDIWTDLSLDSAAGSHPKNRNFMQMQSAKC